jgi:hypothetical protein
VRYLDREENYKEAMAVIEEEEDNLLQQVRLACVLCGWGSAGSRRGPLALGLGCAGACTRTSVWMCGGWDPRLTDNAGAPAPHSCP